MYIIACIEDPVVIEKSLTHLDNKAACGVARPFIPVSGASSGELVRLIGGHHTSKASGCDTSGAAGALSSRAWKPSKNRAEVEHFCRFRGAI